MPFARSARAIVFEGTCPYIAARSSRAKGRLGRGQRLVGFRLAVYESRHFPGEAFLG